MNVAEVGDDFGCLLQSATGTCVVSGDGRQLAEHEDDADAGDKAGHDRERDEAGEPSEPEQPEGGLQKASDDHE